MHGYETEEDAIALANDSNYGLSGYIQSGDLERARRVAGQPAPKWACPIRGGFSALETA